MHHAATTSSPRVETTYYAIRFSKKGAPIEPEKPVFEFEDAGYGAVLGHVSEASSRYPLLHRLRDEYKDADFHASELGGLLGETERLSAESTDPVAKKELARFAEAVRPLIGGAENLCFLGD